MIANSIVCSYYTCDTNHNVLAKGTRATCTQKRKINQEIINKIKIPYNKTDQEPP